MRIRVILRLLIVITIAVLVLDGSELAPGDTGEKARTYTRPVEFDYVSWTADALFLKVSQAALGANRYVRPESMHHLVLEYLQLVNQQTQEEGQVSEIYADPEVLHPEVETTHLRGDLEKIGARLDNIGPLAESTLQSQVAAIAAGLGLTFGGQMIPPVLYHSTPLPMAMILSPRNVIRSDADISLIPDLPLDQITAIENNVSKNLQVSALIVPVGGIGIYPTMVERTDNLPWLTQTISHEWTHNFLTLRPLGLGYDNSPELRTMNETTADLVGKEVGTELLREYYPELVPHPAPPVKVAAPSETATAFNFNLEMHQTRVQVDSLLAAGKIDQAEIYMEARRRVFYQNGYLLRKLNQAYFAFYGAYADVPGGAAGEDPVGPAVVRLRQQSASLADFLNRISWMTSFDQLKQALR